MTQLDLLEPHTKVPPPDSQCYQLLMAMKQGARLTVAKALTEFGVYALSQRCGDLRRKYGWPIQSRMVKTNNGATIAEYWID